MNSQSRIRRLPPVCVLGVINRRADPGSITYYVIPETRLADYLDTASSLHGWSIRLLGEGETQ